MELPEEIANEFQKYTKSYEEYKGNRTLNWRTVTGKVNISIELGDRVLDMTVAPTQAVIIYHFQNKSKYTFILYYKESMYIIKINLCSKNSKICTKIIIIKFRSKILEISSIL